MRLSSAGYHIYADFDVFGRSYKYASNEAGDQPDAGLQEVALPSLLLDCVGGVDIDSIVITPEIADLDVPISVFNMTRFVTTNVSTFDIDDSNHSLVFTDITKKLFMEEI